MALGRLLRSGCAGGHVQHAGRSHELPACVPAGELGPVIAVRTAAAMFKRAQSPKGIYLFLQSCTDAAYAMHIQ